MHSCGDYDLLPMDDRMVELVAKRFQVLGEPNRLRLLQVLKQRAMTVGQLVKQLDGNEPNVSRHLQMLHREGLVARMRKGARVIYSINDSNVFALWDLAVRFEELRM